MRYTAKGLGWYIHLLLPNIGGRYVRYATSADGTWLASCIDEAKLWKTRQGAVNWLLQHKDMAPYISIRAK